MRHSAVGVANYRVFFHARGDLAASNQHAMRTLRKVVCAVPLTTLSLMWFNYASAPAPPLRTLLRLLPALAADWPDAVDLVGKLIDSGDALFDRLSHSLNLGLYSAMIGDHHHAAAVETYARSVDHG